MNDLRTAAQQALDWLYDNDILHPTKVSEDLRTALAQEKAEPAQEPEGLALRYTARIGYVVRPYTAAPPQRKPLTLEEAQTLLKAERIWLSNNTAFRITRVVERAHGIKE